MKSIEQIGANRGARFLRSRGNANSEGRPPNVVLILTDNQGAWTLGCYGNPDIRTPHIDRLAREGMLFERCYSSNAVCSPTRATLLTGLIPSQHGVHSYLAAGGAQMGPRRVLDHRRVSHVARDTGRGGLRVRFERQVALGRQSEAAGGIHLLGDDAARTHAHVLRRRGDRGRQGPQGASLSHRLLDRPRRRVHRRRTRTSRSFCFWRTTGRMAWARACSNLPATATPITTRTRS